MIKMTLKDIKSLCEYIAIDITEYDPIEYRDLKELEKHFAKIGYSTGQAGVTGLLVQGLETRKLYAVTARSSILFNLL